jgi:lambda family phage minor tail protein L
MTDPLIVEGLITLYQLDTTMFPDGQWFYFSSANDFQTTITWGGQDYVPLPISAQGFEMTSKGTLPTPTIGVSNLYGAGNTLLDTFNGLLGAEVTRIVTLRRFLDDGTTPDPNAFITQEVFVVAQKVSHDPLQVSFKLASRMDQEGTQVPRRQILRDVCQHAYRFWDTNLGAFNYAGATCPYTGSAFYDPLDTPTDPTHDQCSRSMNGCTLRFGRWAALPARFFPGVGKVQ